MAEHHSSEQRSGSNREKASYREDSNAVEPKAVTQAMQKAGGVGGISGTGQALPHHGFNEEEDSTREAVGNPVGEEAQLPTQETGSTYQAGGTHLNRDRQAQTRKDRMAGATVASEARGGLDPAPGAPVDRR